MISVVFKEFRISLFIYSKGYQGQGSEILSEHLLLNTRGIFSIYKGFFSAARINLDWPLKVKTLKKELYQIKSQLLAVTQIYQILVPSQISAPGSRGLGCVAPSTSPIGSGLAAQLLSIIYLVVLNFDKRYELQCHTIQG